MNTVKSVGVIMDGNRRWAVENGYSKLDGHKYGMKKIFELVDWVKEERIENLTIYAFSTENWNRSKIEIKAIMLLFEKFLKKEIDKIIDREIKIKFIGDRGSFSKTIQKLMSKVEEKSKDFKTTLFIAMSYGGRLEIIDGIKKIVNDKSKKELLQLTDDVFEKYLWTADLIEPEIIIRTGGDHRISNFLLWKVAYSEFVFTNTKWPAFTKKEFKKILKDYEKVKINKGR